MNDTVKTIKTLEEFDLLIKGLIETIKNEAKKQEGVFLGMLLSTRGASLLGNILAGKSTIKAGEGTVRASQDF